jgi:hypothetical protein
VEALSLNEVRQLFLDFFEERGHLVLPSFSLVPEDDPSVLLINAGMTPMKPWFTGAKTPPSTRVATCQKCIRTPDIDNVGKSGRHGTFFEMLGNFSFGDYFKREAILWGWQFSVDVLKLDPERIYVSIHLDDDEAFEYWRDIGFPAERIFRFDESNFWEHGVGPCGPCSEMFYDRGEAYGCDDPNCNVGCECDRYVEYWNLVFTQFDRLEDGTYVPLEKKNIDTGAGLERIASIVQNVPTLLDVDTVRAIVDKACEVTGTVYGEDESKDIAIRIITDHVRSSMMMIADGVLPGNEGRGYVLRRLIRRAARQGRLLGVDEPILAPVMRVAIAQSKGHYPELKNEDRIIRVLEAEEKRFNRTIEQGFENVPTTYQVLERLIRAYPDIDFNNREMVMISPDEGAIFRTVYYASVLGLPLGTFYKRRDYTVVKNGRNPIIAHEFLGEPIAGRDVMIVDDMISSGESMLEIARTLKAGNARKIFCAATFGLFTDGLGSFDKAYEDGVIDAVFCTNLIYRPPELLAAKWYKDVNASRFVALIIDALNHNASLSSLLDPTAKIRKLLQAMDENKQAPNGTIDKDQ